jgi:hypothetical protein
MPVHKVSAHGHRWCLAAGSLASGHAHTRKLFGQTLLNVYVYASLDMQIYKPPIVKYGLVLKVMEPVRS